MRLQITIDDSLGKEIQVRAHDLGFSVSSYLRYILKSTLTPVKTNRLDFAMNEESKSTTLIDLKKEIAKLRK